MAQSVPFQRSASVTPPGPRASKYPTAMQNLGDGQATPRRYAAVAGAGFRVRWIVHARPFQRAASVVAVAVLVVNEPTAMQTFADGQATLENEADIPLADLGVDWIAHLAPFHRSANRVPRPPRVVEPPTAMQTVRDGQDTLERNVDCAPPGLGVGWIVQPEAVAAAALSSDSANVADPTTVTTPSRIRVLSVR